MSKITIQNYPHSHTIQHPTHLFRFFERVHQPSLRALVTTRPALNVFQIRLHQLLTEDVPMQKVCNLEIFRGPMHCHIAVCCSVWQCVAVWCSVSQYFVSVLQCVAVRVCNSVMQCVAVFCQCVAVCCRKSVLQYDAVCRSILSVCCRKSALQCDAVCRSIVRVLQCVAVRVCNSAMQCVAVFGQCCSVLQCIAMCCSKICTRQCAISRFSGAWCTATWRVRTYSSHLLLPCIH